MLSGAQQTRRHHHRQQQQHCRADGVFNPERLPHHLCDCLVRRKDPLADCRDERQREDRWQSPQHATGQPHQADISGDDVRALMPDDRRRLIEGDDLDSGWQHDASSTAVTDRERLPEAERSEVDFWFPSTAQRSHGLVAYGLPRVRREAHRSGALPQAVGEPLHQPQPEQQHQDRPAELDQRPVLPEGRRAPQFPLGLRDHADGTAVWGVLTDC